MDNPRDKMLRSMCQFLALSDNDKLAFLPAINPNVRYVVNDAGDRTDNPCFYYGNAIYEFIDRSGTGGSDEFSNLIREIGSLLAVMIEQQASYGFIWYLDKKAYGIAGDADRLWRILRRLAIQALTEKQWPQGLPEVPFSETGRTGMWNPASK
jgi:hypothetical protein